MTQEIIVGLIVVGAFTYLGRTVWMSVQGKSDCGCSKGGGCASKTGGGNRAAQELDSPALLQIVDNTRRKK